MSFKLNACELLRALPLLLGLILSNQASAFGSNDGETMVQLFEWRWPDIALECERFLGPKGFAAVQVSPPQEHAVVQGRPWYERYQPVSYKLVSRSGNEQEFRDMVQRCKQAGVSIIVDTVINHMAGYPKDHVVRNGTAGSPYDSYDYPGVYSGWDFNYCGRNGDNRIGNYGDRWEVQYCNLETLTDLKTESSYVRDKIAEYLNNLRAIGVAGFRIDAAKHIPAGDLEAIMGKVKDNPYVYSEVIDFGSEPISGNEYYNVGDVSEFRFGTELNRVFNGGRLAWLETFDSNWGMRRSEKAVVFIDNHDTQRGHAGGYSVLTHKSSELYALASVFMLAHPYGNPLIMSSFWFDNSFQGPPALSSGETKRVWVNGQPQCFGEWVCEHRWQAIANMVQFRKVTAKERQVSNWWSNGLNQIAFSRGDKGFVVLNRQEDVLKRSFQTGMKEGRYCNITAGDYVKNENRCTGETINVHSNGWAEITITRNASVAIHSEAKLN